ncbi:FAD:protein FMN transferase [Bailinhaonella thermotolerans]|uniref:FAD:protein FMN transferase n=1 Tax=Bailinhaonella thermotolerans TaxID=1070861 RepID=A0A3A4AD78_9ACTN|nr:FAD:protein FMN transferase [Bailinhaonella thermotolerans]RJL26625.1 FAD:protein FMN transferase [Bailinhaonella thermotolerans]
MTSPIDGVRERIMGTEVLVAGVPPAEAATVLAWLRRVERTFSRFTAESDAGRANSGRPVTVSHLFLLALADGMAYAEATGGLFSPWLAREMERIGYADDFAAMEGRPRGSAEPAALAGGPGDLPMVEVDFTRRAVRLRGPVGVDLGGFVKGWAVQKAADALREAGVRSGLIDAGGDLVCWRGPAEPAWRIGVEHPLTGEPAAVIEPPASDLPAAVATSSAVRRSWDGAAGERLHHIIDPRTGRPADSDCVQATVFSSDLAAAEVYAKCLVVLGTEEGPAWLSEHDPDAGWIVVDLDGAVVSRR